MTEGAIRRNPFGRRRRAEKRSAFRRYRRHRRCVARRKKTDDRPTLAALVRESGKSLMADDTSGPGPWLGRIDHAGPCAPALATLRALIAAQAATIPYENIDVLMGQPPKLDLASFQRKNDRRRTQRLLLRTERAAPRRSAGPGVPGDEPSSPRHSRTAARCASLRHAIWCCRLTCRKDRSSSMSAMVAWG